MSFDLATAYTKLGIAPGTRDADITAALNVALAIVESFLDRRLAYKREKVRFWPGKRLQVGRWPIVAVHSINGVAPGSRNALVHGDFGLIELFGGFHANADGYIEIDYEGGFQVLPADLEWAMWLVFTAIWDQTAGFGLPTGAGGAASNAGAIKAVTVDQMTIQYAVDSGSTAASSKGGGDEWSDTIPPAALGVLSRYMNGGSVKGGG